MKELSKIASQVQASSTMAIDSLAKQMKADGIDVVGFGAGEPDFNTPDEIKAAGIRAIEENNTRYTPASGLPGIKKAVCERVKADFHVEYAPSQVMVAAGAKHCVYVALRALVNPGDEVIVPAPYWVSYIELVRMMGGVPVVVTAEESAGFKITAQQLRDAITCVANDLYIIADEIYSCLLYDGLKFTSVASLGDEVKKHTILINGVSKAYAMTGWRIGYALAETEIIKVMSNYLSHCAGSCCTISQMAAEAALSGSQEKIESMRQAFEERRNYLVERMNQVEGVSCIKPEGAFYVMMNMEKLVGRSVHGQVINTCDDFSQAFLKYGLVATVPGTAFGAPNFVRWSYATSMENIKKGMDRLEAFLKEFQ